MITLGSVAKVLLRHAAENAYMSSHGPWKIEASSVRMMRKAEKLPETAKSLG